MDLWQMTSIDKRLVLTCYMITYNDMYMYDLFCVCTCIYPSNIV